MHQRSAPREPTTEPKVAVVAIAAHSQLEALILAYRHVAQRDQVAFIIALT